MTRLPVTYPQPPERRGRRPFSPLRLVGALIGWTVLLAVGVVAVTALGRLGV